MVNSSLLWEEGENKPRWVKDFGLLNENGGVDSPARRAVFNSVRYHCHG